MSDTMLDMYLFENVGLLEQLDEVLLSAEKASDFGADDINEIFRIMHTIKGSSAMMEFDSLMNTAHYVEDLFYYIRENGFDVSYASPLFDLMFESADLLKSEIEKIQNGQPLTSNIDSFILKINTFLEKIKKGEAPTFDKGSTPAPVESSVATPSASKAPSSGSDFDDLDIHRINVLFDVDCSMENLRALMLVTLIKEIVPDFTHNPPNLESDENAANHISEYGFDMFFNCEDDLNKALQIVKKSSNVRRYTPVDLEIMGDELIQPTITKAKVTVFFDYECGMENLRAMMIKSSLDEVIKDFSVIPADVETNPSTATAIADHGFTILLEKSTDLKSTIDIVKQTSNIRDYEVIEEIEEPKAETKSEAKKDGSKETPAPAKTAQSAQSKQSLISVNLQKLDSLMNIVGEIVITESMVTSSPEVLGLNLDSFTKSARQLRKLTDELQDIVMSIRMVPVSGVFQKMNRIVRDMDKKLGKPVELVMVGEHTEVDKAIVDGISDPIMHLVRNAMDHGIENAPSDRTAKGKDAKGTIILSAEHTGSDVLISVSDDGKGIDPDVILEKADGKGLLSKPREEYTKKEILNLLMMPGFSTKEQVTEFSGRGVGMDVVKQNIEKIGGTVNINSEFGKGSSVVFRIPLTLAIASCMKVSVSNSIYTIPINNIKQSFKANPSDIILDSDNNEMIRWMGNFYKVLRLHKIYDINNSKTDLTEGIMVLVEADDRTYCLFVDELLGEHQVVVKPLPEFLKTFDIKASGIAGCTILGDGQISLILDVFTLHDIN